MNLARIWNWFTGGSRPYMSLTCCMNYDWPWIAITVGLNAAVAVGYLLIAMHWWQNQRVLDDRTPAKLALGRLRNIFILCGTCGYLFVILKMFWPAWRLYDMVLVGLVAVTWKYRWGVRNLRIVYQELNRSKQLAEDLEESRADSRRKSFFLSSLSHDLRTPLNGLMLQAELAEMALGESDEAEVRSALNEIRQAALASSNMLQNFLEMGWLDWSREPVRAADFPPVEFVRQVLRGFQAEADRKGLSIAVDGRETLIIRTDRGLLERILINLVSNAIKFTIEGKIDVHVRERDDGVSISVEDTGIGIEPEAQSQLFDEFFQVQNRERDRSKGYGLGLSIVRRLARRLGGDVQVESTPGRGSRFSVLLPVQFRETGADDGHRSKGNRVEAAAPTRRG